MRETQAFSLSAVRRIQTRLWPVGLCISDRYVRFVELSGRGRGRLEPTRLGRRALPSGAVSGGEVHDAKRLRSVLASLAYDYGFERVRVAFSGLGISAFLMRISEVPDSAALRSLIEFELEERVRDPQSDIVFDWEILGETTDPSCAEVAVFVYSHALLEGYVEAFEGTGLSPVSFEGAPFATARAVTPEGARGARIIADIRGDDTLVMVTRGGHVVSIAVVPIGGASFSSGASGGGLVALAEVLDRVIVGLSRQDGVRIGLVALCGKAGGAPGLSELLAAHLKTNVEPANVWRNVCSFDDVIPPISWEKSLEYAGAIGAALRGIR